MPEIHVAAERVIPAPADQLYGYLAGYREHHPKILPPVFSPLTIEAGGVGAGTVIRFHTRTAGRVRHFRLVVTEPEPGRVLVESDTLSNIVTTFTVSPVSGGSRVRIESRWTPAGLEGLFERLLAPLMMRPLYADELKRLAEYAQRTPPP
jgi:hypothetical protein